MLLWRQINAFLCEKKLYLVLRMLYIDIYPNFLSYQPMVPASTLLLQAQRRKSRSQIQRDHPRVKHRGHLMGFLDFPGSSTVKNPPAMQETCRRCRFDPWIGKIPWRRKWQPTPVFLPEKFHGLQPDKLLWEIPWTEEPGGLQCMGLQRAEHDWLNNNGLLIQNFRKHSFSDKCLYLFNGLSWI